MRQSDNIAELAAALVKAQGKFPTLKRDRTGQTGKRQYEYATQKQAIEVTQPILAEHGLAVLQFPSTTPEGMAAVTLRILHESGEWLEETISFPARLEDMQEGAKLITAYARVTYVTALRLAVENEDAPGAARQAGGQQGPPPQQQRQKKQDDPLADKRKLVGAALNNLGKALEMKPQELLQRLTRTAEWEGWKYLSKADESALDLALKRIENYEKTGSLDPDQENAA